MSVASTIVLALLGGSPAEVVDLRLQWNAPSECEDTPALRRRVFEIVGDVAGSDSNSPVSVQGQVTGDVRRGYALELAVDDGEAVVRRHLEAADCEALAEGAALIVGFAIAPAAVGLGEEPLEPEPEPEAAPEAEPPPEEPEVEPEPEPAEPENSAEPTDDEPKPPRSRFTLAAEVGADFSLIDTASLALGARAGWMRGPWRLTGGVLTGLPRRVVAPGGAVVDAANVWLFAGEVLGCGVPSPGRFEIPICGGGAVGLMRGQGDGLQAPRAATEPWAAAIASVGLTVPVGPRLAVLLAARGIVPLVRPAFGFLDGGGVTEIVRAPPVGGRISVGLELRLP
ncbi:MAG: hypothetical protein AAF799_12770 [Myxococcota bacterium]